MPSKSNSKTISNLLGWMKLGNAWIRTIFRQWKRRGNVERVNVILVVVLQIDVTLIEETDQGTDDFVPDRGQSQGNAGDTAPGLDLWNVEEIDHTAVNIVLYLMGFIYRLLWISANRVVARTILINRSYCWTEFDIKEQLKRP